MCFGMWHLPLRSLGLRGVPAVPVTLRGLIRTAIRLYGRAKETQPARDGLTTTYTIDGTTATALEFLYGVDPEGANSAGGRMTLPQARAARSSLQKLSLDAPEQFAMSWTTFANVYRDSEPSLSAYAAALTDAETATRAFWPTIASNGMAYNHLMLEKARPANLALLGARFGRAWSPDWDTAAERGALYAIDLSIFASLPVASVNGFPRFTPATVILLIQDAETRALTPVAVRVAGQEDSGARTFVRGQATESAWIYALQAARTSVTVHGIWLGHVYHWHVVTAAMQMSMFATLGRGHPVRRLLGPQSKYLIQFDELLLILWSRTAPPTSVSTAAGFLRLADTFAAGRVFFDDDPAATLERNGIAEEDFSREAPWDAWPTAGRLLGLWRETERYVHAFVETTYADDILVAEDPQLQAWRKAATSSGGGNVRGLPELHSREALERVLTSLVQRITAHGSSRLKPSAYPAQAFVANFPPCLQDARIPLPEAEVPTADLMEYLPKTGTIGEMMTFYTTFIFSRPYEPLIPENGIETELFWPMGMKDPRNRALVAYRNAVRGVMEGYEGDEPRIHQWPMSIET